MTTLDELVAAPLSPEAFVDALQVFATSSRAANHPLFEVLRTSRACEKPAVLRSLLREYYVYSRSFTRHLAAVTANLEDPQHRNALVPNAVEEAGAIDEEHLELLAEHGLTKADVALPHPTLFLRFLEALGFTPLQLSEPAQVATTVWIETFHAVCRGGEAEGVGALGIATEGIVRTTYLALMQSITKTFPHLTPPDTAFFVLHTLVDDEHALVLRDIACALAITPESRRRMAVGVGKSLAARASFFDAMLEQVQHQLADGKQAKRAA